MDDYIQKARAEKLAELRMFDLIDEIREKLEDLVLLSKERPKVLPRGYIIYGLEMPDGLGGLGAAAKAIVEEPEAKAPGRRRPSRTRLMGIGKQVLEAILEAADGEGWAERDEAYKRLSANSAKRVSKRLYLKSLGNAVYRGWLKAESDDKSGARKLRLTEAGGIHLKGEDRKPRGPNRTIVAHTHDGATLMILGALDRESWKTYEEIEAAVELPHLIFAKNFRNCIYRQLVEEESPQFARRRMKGNRYRLTEAGTAAYETLTGDADVEDDEPEPEIVPRSEPSKLQQVYETPEFKQELQKAQRAEEGVDKPLTQSAIEALLPAAHRDLEQALRDTGFDVSGLGAKLHEMREEDLIHIEAGEFHAGPPRTKDRTASVKISIKPEGTSPFGDVEFPSAEEDSIPGDPDVKITISETHLAIMRAIPQQGSIPNDVVRRKTRLDPMGFGTAMSFLTRAHLVKQSARDRLALSELGKRLLAHSENVMLSRMARK